MTRQAVIGGALGVLLLLFALVYRFFPGILHVDRELAETARPAAGAPATMGFQARRGGPALLSATDAGPPLSLASSAVIMAHRAAAGGAPASAQVTAWLKAGDAALDAGRYTGAEGAATWYGKVLEVDADNRAASAGAAEVARHLSSNVDTALLHADFTTAERLLSDLRGVPLASTEVARLEAKLQVQEKVAPMLTDAADLLQRGRDLKPKSGNALAVYRAVLKLDPDNAVAKQGLLQIQRGVLDQALAALAQNDLQRTDAELAEAAKIVADSPALQDTRARVERLRRDQAGNTLAQARSALDAGNLQLAQSLADQALAISPDLPGMDDFNTRMRNARLYASFKPGQSFQDRFLDRAGSAPTMVVVPTGSFRMGDAADGPVHDVTLARGFAIARSEVTVAEFGAFVAATGYTTDAERGDGGSVYDERNGRLHDAADASWRDGYEGRTAKPADPVLNVSWNDAAAYVKWLGERTGKVYRLPSEAEFEYALRGGTTTRYWWGDDVPTGPVENVTGSRDRSPRGRRWNHAFANYGDGFWGPAPVMQFRANPFGLYDMDGNLSEWVMDCWHDNYVRAPRDGSAWVNPGCSRRVVRGGSWGSAPEQVRSAFRQAADADTRSARVGFRVVREL